MASKILIISVVTFVLLANTAFTTAVFLDLFKPGPRLPGDLANVGTCEQRCRSQCAGNGFNRRCYSDFLYNGIGCTQFCDCLAYPECKGPGFYRPYNNYGW
ncbi:unnamed protein product [Allacma fusca]|uniref:Uncharacterized protein n=1 Tax=Allacma fusca TaxID=39272 RepID=A0A8J2K823_9HEXA|nr:unnamed protein product [Allacma fusca]